MFTTDRVTVFPLAGVYDHVNFETEKAPSPQLLNGQLTSDTRLSWNPRVEARRSVISMSDFMYVYDYNLPLF